MENQRTPVEFFLVSYLFHFYDRTTIDRKLINSLILKKREDKLLTRKDVIDRKPKK